MQSKLFSVALIGLMLVTTPASAEWYMAGQVGANLLTDSAIDNRAGTAIVAEFKPGIAVSGEIGFAFSGNFRLGVEGAYRTNHVDHFSRADRSTPDSAEMNSGALMGNLWYDVPTENRARPFVGFGIGLVRLDVDKVINTSIFVDDVDDSFAFQVGAGLVFEFKPKMELSVEYRYFHADDPSFPGADAESMAHSIMAGLRFSL